MCIVDITTTVYLLFFWLIKLLVQHHSIKPPQTPSFHMNVKIHLKRELWQTTFLSDSEWYFNIGVYFTLIKSRPSMCSHDETKCSFKPPVLNQFQCHLSISHQVGHIGYIRLADSNFVVGHNSVVAAVAGMQQHS